MQNFERGGGSKTMMVNGEQLLFLGNMAIYFKGMASYIV